MKNSLRMLLALLAWSISPEVLRAANGPETSGGPAAGLSGAAVGLTGLWAVTNNVAGIAGAEKAAVGVYARNRFGLNALSTVSLLGVLPLPKKLCLGVELSRFGDQWYNEQQAGLGLAHRLGPVQLGLKATLWQLHLEGLGSKRTLALSFGGQSEVLPGLVFGAHIFNLNQARLARIDEERLPTVMAAGLTYRAADHVLLTLQTDKQVDLPADVKVGIEYILREKLFFRSGFSWERQSLTGGLGFKAQAFFLDYALAGHAQLGLSNHVSLSYGFR